MFRFGKKPSHSHHGQHHNGEPNAGGHDPLTTLGNTRQLSIELRPKFKTKATTSTVSTVSTLSSVSDIIKCVSEANAATNAAKPHSGGAPSAAASGSKLGSKISKITKSATTPVKHDAIESPDDESIDERRALAGPDALTPPSVPLTITPCISCGSKLEIPQNIQYFKCSVCDTYRDLNIEHKAKQELVPAPFSLDAEFLKKLADASMAGSEDKCAQLNSLLSQVFSSISCVNHLFLLRRDKPHKTSYSRPNLDYRLVEKFYAAILEGRTEPTKHDSCVEFNRQVSKSLMSKMIALLKRPDISFEVPKDLSFLLICFELPLLYKGSLFSSASSSTRGIDSGLAGPLRPANMAIEILERVCGLLIHSSDECQHYFLNWLIRAPVSRFQPKVDVINAYISHQLTYHYREKRKRKISLMQRPPAPESSRAVRRDSSEGLQPLMSRGPNFGNSRDDNTRKKRGRPVIKTDVYTDDWRIHLFVRVMAIFFNANVFGKQKVPISSFYNTMVDFTDILKDFDEWQRSESVRLVASSDGGGSIVPSNSAAPLKVSKSRSFSGATQIYSEFTVTQESKANTEKLYFCKYSFLLSMGAKSEILEHDALRQMELEAQEAFFGSLLKKQPVSPYVNIRVRRSHLLQDSFSEFERHEGKFRKALRVEFVGESGVDAGGLKKEWFLLLLRQLFDSKAGQFYEEEESHYFWFDANPSHPLKYYKLTGVAIGLALYNSTILDLNLPPVIFKKLLGHAYTLDDFVALKPSYGQSLKKMLEYQDDDFEEVFSLNFVVHSKDEVTGKVSSYELIGGGEGLSVTKENRQDYVRRVMTYFFDHKVRKQFEAFKAGFCSIVEGNALMLFRPEEIELLVRGSLEPIDVDALRSVTKYHHWCPKGYNAESDPVIQWFWQYFRDLGPEKQRKLLMFITGSDRVPATGIANMPFRVSRMGEDCDRLPTAHTCFNQICLYAYSSREKLYKKLEMAVNESQGFDMK